MTEFTINARNDLIDRVTFEVESSINELIDQISNTTIADMTHIKFCIQ